MKRRTANDTSPAQQLDALCEALDSLEGPEEIRAFLTDLCTPAEMQALADRWRVVPLILQGVPYREIHDLTGVSVTTVGRVARSVEFGAGGYRRAAERCADVPAVDPSEASH
ncbi:YerC/YecD family TrpR-related protein [Alkalisalibacterium limincola]|uniref:DNA-binding transcriptional regulator n=1 Tax=Alkalisalibacterium limincola TaxID=2699169 RepID=A0A5C8KZB5_9GAMM|nr:YerC/YecD family TrpR-related protein [Alkalisalibacterium limincola]TXK65802.1 DNA-binding transcriptional regulator [Alkalisalibacterium limincola]